MTNFQDILNTRADTIEAPKSLPPGKYSASVKSFEPGTSTQKKTPYVEVKFLVESGIDLAPEYEELANVALQKGPVEMKVSYYLTDKSTYRLIDFLEKDLSIPRGQKSIGEMLSECIGLACSVVLDTEVSKDGREFIGIKRTGKV